MITCAQSIARKSAGLLGVLLAVAAAAFADPGPAPEVPDILKVPVTYKVTSRVFASGVQIYTAVPSAADPTQLVWALAGPDAVLYGFDGAVVGRHFAFAGPTRPGWTTNSGSLVVAARTIPAVTVDPNAIPWLLLDAVHTEGEGGFAGTTFIQRVNTTGGLAPALPPTHLGAEARIGYTAIYVFYRPVTAAEAPPAEERRSNEPGHSTGSGNMQDVR